MTDDVLLHLHIPKVGGTTLREVLYDQYRTEPYFSAEDGYFHAGVYYYPADVIAERDSSIPDSVRRALTREDMRAVLGHFGYGIHECLTRPASYITLLREPADRLVSLYFLLLQLPDRYAFPRSTSFHDFVSGHQYIEAYNDQTRRIAGAEPGSGPAGRAVLERAKENLGTFRVVGTMERFDETLVLLKQRFGWEKPLKYYPERQNPGRPSVRMLPQKTLDVIRERSALDYELYEFAKSILDDAIASAGASFKDEVQLLREATMTRYEEVARKLEAENRAKRESTSELKPTGSAEVEASAAVR